MVFFFYSPVDLIPVADDQLGVGYDSVAVLRQALEGPVILDHLPPVVDEALALEQAEGGHFWFPAATWQRSFRFRAATTWTTRSCRNKFWLLLRQALALQRTRHFLVGQYGRGFNGGGGYRHHRRRGGLPALFVLQKKIYR
jgi:hypothetical protein